MDQEPQETPSQGSGSKPGIFQNINGVIAGITGLVIALGGLAATWDRIFPDKKADQEVVAETDNLAQPATAADAAAAPEQGDPTVYEADGIKLEWSGDEWLLTDGDTTYHYEDMYSPDETKVLAFDKANSSYLRWPTKGGMAETGSADKQTWTNYAELYPPEEQP